MRRWRSSVGMFLVLALVAPALIIMLSPLTSTARPPVPVPTPGGDDGNADPDALGTEAPSLPPDTPHSGSALDWGEQEPGQNGIERAVREAIHDLWAFGIIRVLMSI